MTMRFSQRLGYTSVKTAVQRETLDVETRNGLWSVLVITCFEEAEGTHLHHVPVVDHLTSALWVSFFKLPIDSRPDWAPQATQYVRNRFFAAEWYEALDLVEFISHHHPGGEQIRALVNNVLEREVSAYRFVGEVLAEITSSEEIEEIEAATEAAPAGSRIHLQQAVALLADRTKPDYRNSIKESISAVEATLNHLAGTSNLSLGDAMKRLGLDNVHGAFRAALGNLYGYTSDGDGIRHSLLDESNLDFADAKFMLVTCSAFVNYVLAKRAA